MKKGDIFYFFDNNKVWFTCIVQDVTTFELNEEQKGIIENEEIPIEIFEKYPIKNLSF